MNKFFKGANPPKYTGEYAVIMAAEIVGEDATLNPRIQWIPVDAIPSGLCEIYTQAGVRYWGKP